MGKAKGLPIDYHQVSVSSEMELFRTITSACFSSFYQLFYQTLPTLLVTVHL
jgi:hypothetical protein